MYDRNDFNTYFKITIFYYNPNISPYEEFIKRVEEQKRLIRELPVKNKVNFKSSLYFLFYTERKLN